MKVETSFDILEKYRSEIGSDVETVFLDSETQEFLGYGFEETDEIVWYVNVCRDYREVWKLDENAIRLGTGEHDPFDEGIVGYVKDDFGNLHMVYDSAKCCESYAEENDCPIEDAFEWWDCNTLRSLPYCDERHRPMIMETLF